MAKIEVITQVKVDGKVKKQFEFVQTAKPAKNKKTGLMSMAHFQPAPECKVLKPYGKIYLDTVELAKSK